MKIYVDRGKKIPYTNTGSAITSGTPIKKGAVVGIADGDIPATSGVGFLELEGVFTVPTDTGTAWTQGDVVYWDDTGKVFTKTSTSNTKCGFAFADKASGTATAQVKLVHAI